MAATITELSTEDFPCNLISGTGKKRVKIFFRSTTASAGSSINLASYIGGLQDIEGVVYTTSNNASSGTAGTWSTTTYTIGAGMTNPEICLIGTF